jgi:hypothetical protein
VLQDHADKGAIIVDNYPGEGNGDVYFAIQWVNGSGGLILSRSGVDGASWQVLHTSLGGRDARRPTFGITTNALTGKHEVVLGWLTGTNQFLFSKSVDRGTNFNSPSAITVFSNSALSFKLLRTRSSSTNDFFRGPIVPTIVANPVNGHLYAVYHDAPTNGAAPNIYFIQSADGGTNWSHRIQVNVETNAVGTDQWQPVITVKPDGTAVFIAWYDRRNDPIDNSLMETWGVIASLPVTNIISFANNFRISAVQFPPVFTGTSMTNLGEFDPVYPPSIRNDGIDCPTFNGNYANHMADYDTAVSDSSHIYYTWADNRNRTCNMSATRKQADVRLVKIPW